VLHLPQEGDGASRISGTRGPAATGERQALSSRPSG
jgi:hypothetical protein